MIYECKYKHVDGKGIYETVINPKIVIDVPMKLMVKKKIDPNGQVILLVEMKPIDDINILNFGKYKGEKVEKIAETGEGRKYLYSLLGANKSNIKFSKKLKELIIMHLADKGSYTQEELLKQFT